MKKLLLIVNPNAGKKQIREKLTDVISLFNRASYQTEVYMTSARADAVAAVKRFGADKDLIVAAGGDGTYNEVIRGLVSAELSIPLGYLPAGSTNDFAASIGLSSDPLIAASSIISGTPHSYDVGKFGDTYFSYIASFGAFTRASYATSQDLKNTLGHLAYILEGIKEISQIQPRRMRFDIDGQVIEDDFLFAGICNSKSIAGVLTLDSDRVDMSDGRFEILLVRSPKTLGDLKTCISALRYSDFSTYNVRLYHASRVSVKTNPNLSWSLDGEEAAGAPEILIENLHNRITLIH